MPAGSPIAILIAEGEAACFDKRISNCAQRREAEWQ
jgi:hypothetical protein